MVQKGSTIPSFVLISTIVLFIRYVECGPMLVDTETALQAEAKAEVLQYLTVHQVTHISRRKRNDIDHVVFPKMMAFDLEFNDRKVNIRLKKHDFMTGDIHIMTSDGPIRHDMGRKTGVYQDSSNGASFIVQCEDYNEHCTLQGSMMVGDDMWMITPEKDTPQLHKAVQRQNIDKTKLGFGSVPPSFNIEQELKSSRYTSDASPREKRSVPADCDIVECYAIVDETVWDLYFNLSGRVNVTAEKDLGAYYLALYNQADSHFEDLSKIRNGSCLRLFYRGVAIQKTKAESWSFPAEIDISGAEPLIAYVEGVQGLNECGQDGDTIRTEKTLSVDLFQCFTRKDIVWNEGTRTQNFKAFYRSLAYRFMVCDSSFAIYQSSLIETQGDDVEVLLAKVIAQGCGSNYDSETTCSDDDFYINARETLVSSDTLKHRNVWYFSSCTLGSIADNLGTLNTNCLRTSTITHSEYDNFVNQPFAGRLYTWEEQCVNRFGNNSQKCDPTGQNRTYFDDMCSEGIYCTYSEFGDGSCVGVTRPFEGTPCGTFGSYCFKSDCIILNGLGESCTCHDRCSANFSLCDTTQNFTCRCQGDYYDDDGTGNIGGNCIPKVAVGQPCPQPDACLDANAVCNNSNCTCIPGFYEENGACFQLLCFGDACNNTYQCQGDNVECLGSPSTCRCSSDRYFNVSTGNCDEKKDLGAICDDGECLVNNSVCGAVSGECECQEGFYDTNSPADPAGRCEAKLSLGTICPQTDSCADPNAVCSVTCRCKDGFFNNNGICERKKCIGESCFNVTDCENTGAECTGSPSTCRCPDDTFLNETTATCDTKKDLGSPCESGQCSPVNSVCDSSSNVCECQEGFFDSDGSGTPGGSCNAKLDLGTACTQSDSCSDPNAECSTTCRCVAGFYNNGGTCERLRSIGESCVNVTACLTTGAECAGSPLTCRCPDSTFLNDTTNTCDTKKDLGSPCESGQCSPANSVCDSSSNVCECQEGFFDSDGSGTPGGSCNAKLDLGTSCTQSDSCSDPNAECSTTCRCIAGFYNNGGTCERLRSIGESCVNVTACLTTGAECAGTPLTCRCPDSTFLNDTTNTCDTKKDLGSPCESGQCSPANSVCDSSSNVCECQEGFFDSDGSGTPGGSCNAKLDIGTSCTQSDSCSDPNAVCSTTCRCIAGFYNNGGTCERLRSIGESCINVTACLTTGAECAGTPLICRCPDSTFLNDTTNTCDTKKDLGSQCESGQCSPANSVCDSSSNVCECQEGFFDSDGPGTPGGSCNAKLDLGTSCTQSDSCLDPNAECSTTCRCIAGFYNNGGTCERLRSIGESCVNVTACLTTGAECAGSPLTCRCPDSTFLNDTTNTCDTKKDLGSPCESGQCSPANSVCDSSSNVCECQEGFFDSDGSGTPGGSCDAKLDLETSCTQSDSCSDPNAECSTTCRCTAGFYNNGGSCERLRSIGESCVNVTACLTTGAECGGTPLTCRCPDSTFLNDTTNTCDTKKDLGSPCESGQCSPANSVCDSSSNVCECQEGFFDSDGSGTPGGSCDATLDLGVACTQPDSCSDPNAECSGTCQCKAGFYNNGGTCARQSGIGESCGNVTACLTPGAECSGSPLTCRCPDSTFLNDTDGTCDAKKGINEDCETGQCADPNAVCQPLTKICTCGDGFVINDTQCVLSCPIGSEAFGTSCYLFGQNELLYSVARETCFNFSTDTLSGSLVQVDTTEELNFLKNFMLNRAVQPTNGYWNDLFETTTNGNETWSTTGDPLVNWNPPQPDDRGEIQLCTMFFKQFNYQQADIECLDPVSNIGRDNRPAFALCEIDLTVIP